MRVVVTGMVASYPIGGVAWDYLQYVQGFAALGCDVWYLEDTGQWVYDPAAQTFAADATKNVRWLAAAIARLSPALVGRWAVRGADGKYHGLDEAALAKLLAGTDLFLNVSGSCWLRDAYRSAKVKAYVDTDPCYSQAKLAAVEAGTADGDTEFSVDLIRGHDVFFTNGENIGAPDCLIPTFGLRWHPTRQPIVPANFPWVEPRAGAAFTTVMSWKTEPRPPVLGGHAYGGKDLEFEKIIDLPGRTSERLEVAVSGAAPRERLTTAGWRVVDGHAVSSTMQDYRGYLQRSAGELSIAKNAYVATRSGWFSTRSAAYLACGRPVVVQDTGWSSHIPPGPGLRPFRTADEALAGLEAVRANYARACEHARESVLVHFDAAVVCRRILTDCGL